MLKIKEAETSGQREMLSVGVWKC